MHSYGLSYNFQIYMNLYSFLPAFLQFVGANVAAAVFSGTGNIGPLATLTLVPAQDLCTILFILVIVRLPIVPILISKSWAVRPHPDTFLDFVGGPNEWSRPLQ